ncbi:MAG: hypothetical protein H7Z75_04135 [Ferruginibacter sp.]|nr:hypothetical protein [Cytophagales bacterium]
MVRKRGIGTLFTAGPYDAAFWAGYNRPVDTELAQRIKADLAKKEPLEHQFKNNTASREKP